MKRFSRADLVVIVLGGFDGTCSIMGMVLGVAVLEGVRAIAIAAIGSALSASSSMSGAELLSVDEEDGRKVSTRIKFHRAAVMWLVTIIFSVPPAVPFYVLSKGLAFVVCGVIVMVLLLAVARARPGGWIKSLRATVPVFVLATAIGMSGSLIAGTVA
jgi:hypothetical protein